MEILEKAIYQIDRINNANYKDEKGNKTKKTKLAKRYNLCDKHYLNYLKSYMKTTKHHPKKGNVTIVDITSGTGILALSFLNAIYDENLKYKVILNDILFKDTNDFNIKTIITILNTLNSEIQNLELIITDNDILNSNEESLSYLKSQLSDNFILITDPSISLSNANSFKDLDTFISNITIQYLLENASYTLFKDTINIKKKCEQLFKYKRYDQLEEGLNIDLISKDKINLLRIFDKYINKNVETVALYNPEKLAKIYCFYDTSKLEEGEMSNFYYNGYTLDNSTVEYQSIEDENKKMKKIYDEISVKEISKKYEDLKAQL